MKRSRVSDAKSKTSRWLAGPYLLWMGPFIIVPLFIVIWYALTNADAKFRWIT